MPDAQEHVRQVLLDQHEQLAVGLNLCAGLVDLGELVLVQLGQLRLGIRQPPQPVQGSLPLMPGPGM